MRRLPPFLLALTLLGAPAEAVTLHEIISLSKAGLGDEVLLALIEVDGGVFSVDPDSLTRLKQAGVSERVIVALIRSGREPVLAEEAASAPAEPEPPQPQVVVIEHEQPVIREVAVPVPVYVPVLPYRHRGARTLPQDPRFYALDPRFDGGPYLTDTPPPPKRSEPVYWGWGGKLRPDAWKPKQ